MAAAKNRGTARRTEPAARQGAAAAMSAQLLSEAAPPRRAAPIPVSPREDAFEAWLRRELGRLYDTALTEPVPETLTRLLDSRPNMAAARRR